MYVAAIVVAAGRGLRFRSKALKPFVKLNARPIISYCLSSLDKHPSIKEIVVVVNPVNFNTTANTIRRYRIGKLRTIIPGGRRRQDSVRCGLGQINTRADLVLIHDAVRPFIDRRILSSVIREAEETGAATVAVPVEATIKKVKSQKSKVKTKLIVQKTIDRRNLWEAQTPQVFKKGLILEAHNRFARFHVTDDATMVEKLGAMVSIVEGSDRNIKITTPEDLVIAEAILSQNSKGKSQKCNSKVKTFKF